jgi:hypothetical protein
MTYRNKAQVRAGLGIATSGFAICLSAIALVLCDWPMTGVILGGVGAVLAILGAMVTMTGTGSI